MVDEPLLAKGRHLSMTINNPAAATETSARTSQERFWPQSNPASGPTGGKDDPTSLAPTRFGRRDDCLMSWAASNGTATSSSR